MFLFLHYILVYMHKGFKYNSFICIFVRVFHVNFYDSYGNIYVYVYLTCTYIRLILKSFQFETLSTNKLFPTQNSLLYQNSFGARDYYITVTCVTSINEGRQFLPVVCHNVSVNCPI